MSNGAFRRVIEGFFRRWPFYVLLLVASMALGVLSVSRTSDEFTSTGAIFVDAESLVTAQSGVQDGGFFSFLNPAQFTSQELSGLISTDVFMESALERADVELASQPLARATQVDQFRPAITSFASSENLVSVAVTTPEPDLSARLAQAIIDEFVQFQINVDIAESGASEEFFGELVEDYRQGLVDARSDVDRALRGITDLEDLPPERQLEVERLQAAEVLAAERFVTAVQNVEASRLATLQTETDVRQGYSVFDPPQVPVEPNGSVLDDLTTLAIFLLVGLIAMLVGPLASALLNRAVLFPDDLELGPELGVVAVVPRTKRRDLKLDEVEVTAEDADPDVTTIEHVARRTITLLPTENGSLVEESPERAAEAPAADTPNAARPLEIAELTPTRSETPDAVAAPAPLEPAPAAAPSAAAQDAPKTVAAPAPLEPTPSAPKQEAASEPAKAESGKTPAEAKVEPTNQVELESVFADAENDDDLPNLLEPLLADSNPDAAGKPAGIPSDERSWEVMDFGDIELVDGENNKSSESESNDDADDEDAEPLASGFRISGPSDEDEDGNAATDKAGRTHA